MLKKSDVCRVHYVGADVSALSYFLPLCYYIAQAAVTVANMRAHEEVSREFGLEWEILRSEWGRSATWNLRPVLALTACARCREPDSL